MTDEIKRYNDSMDILNRNLMKNTSEVVKLRAEEKLGREVNEKNMCFLQDVIRDLLRQQKDEKKNMWDIIKTGANVLFKIALAVTALVVTLKVFDIFPFG